MYYVTAAAQSCLFPGSLNYVSAPVMYWWEAQVCFVLLGRGREIYYIQTQLAVCVWCCSWVAKLVFFLFFFYRADCVTFEGSDFQQAWQPNKGAAETNSSLRLSCWGSGMDGRITTTVLRLHFVKALQKKRPKHQWEAERSRIHPLAMSLQRFDPYWCL